MRRTGLAVLWVWVLGFGVVPVWGAAPPVAPASGSTGPAGAAASSPSTSARFKHIWTFVFENTNYDTVTAQSMPYLEAQAAKGVTLTQMYGVGHASLTNYIAMSSGYEPNPKTQADCFAYDCIYEPGHDNNVADQLEASKLTWRAYMDGLPSPCAKGKEGSSDPYVVGYATRHNPFMYYRSIVGNASRCAEHVRPIADLATDRAAGTVANYNFISPDTCNDADDDSKSGCGLPDADKWLQAHLDPILASKEYRDGGAVVVTFDEAELSDTSNCCGTTPAGGHIATVVLSPNLVAPGTSDATHYSHYSLLRTVEDNFGLPPLRHAADASTTSMIALFKAPAAPTTTSAPTSTTTAASSTTSSSSSRTSKNKHTTLWLLGGLLVVIGVGTVVNARRRSNNVQSKQK